MNLEVNPEEKQYLTMALQHYLSELNGEIRSTDNADYRDDLKREQEILMMLRQKLGRE